MMKPMNRINALHWILTGLSLLLLSLSAFATERVTYYHNDVLGSPIAATNQNGTLLWREAYEPYGERLLDQAGSSNDRWYTGKQEEAAFGINYFGARWYDPSIGRFMAIDPVSFHTENIQSFNRYAYANNNPYKYVDPDGEVPILLVGFFAYDVYQSYQDSGNFGSAVGDAAIGLLNPFKKVKTLGSVASKVTSSKATKRTGLETRGVRPAPGTRTIQGQVDAATQAGNPTVQRGGQDLFRLRSSGHGQGGATATPQNVRNVRPADGKVFVGQGSDRAVTPRDIRELYKAQTGQGTSSIRTRSGR